MADVSPGHPSTPAPAGDTVTRPLLPPRELDVLRAALGGFTVEAVDELIGLEGRAAHARGDLAGVARRVRAATDRDRATLIDLFLLGAVVDETAAARALHPLVPDRAAPLLEVSAGTVRARYEIRPYGEAGSGAAWLVVSDFGSDVRPGPLARNHVLGVGSASTTLALATPRAPAGRALDLGTGCGVQALHLSRHAASIVGTDISVRALACAATTAALSGVTWDLRSGSLLDPVAGERFDLVVANPPFVVSPGTDTYEYRDSGLPGDAVCAHLVAGLPHVLEPGGCAQLLANWIVPLDGTPWTERVGGWLAGSGCDAWVWQREVADPAEYVSLWLRDAGHHPGEPDWSARYDAWADWFAAAGVAAIGMGLITLWRPPAGDEAAGRVVVLEDVPQAVEQPAGPEVAAWIIRARWSARTSDEALLATSLRPAPDLVRTRDDLLGPDGWRPAAARLRQSHGMRWEVDVDDAVAGIVAACDGRTPLGVVLAVLAATLDVPPAEVGAAALPVLRDLLARGVLLPPDVGGPP